MHAVTPPLRHPVEVQPARRHLQRPVRHVNAQDLAERGVVEEGHDQGALSAAKVRDGGRPGGPQHSHDRTPALRGKGDLPLRCLFRLTVAHGVVQRFRLRVVGLGEPAHRGQHQVTPVRQVAAGDQVTVRVRGQPAGAGPDQLVHLVGAHPVVLGVVQHRQQHIQVVQRIGEPHPPTQPQPDIPGVTPLRDQRIERHRPRFDRPAQRPEEPLSNRGPALARQRRDPDLQRQGGGGQFRPAGAPPGDGGAEDPGQGDSHHRRRRVGPVVDVLG